MKSTRWNVRLTGYPMYEVILASRPDRAARRYVTGMAEGNYLVEVQPEQGGKKLKFQVDVVLKPSITVRVKK